MVMAAAGIAEGGISYRSNSGFRHDSSSGQ